MKKKWIYIVLIIVGIVVIYFGYSSYSKKKVVNKRKKLFEMWSEVAKSKNKTIDENKVMVELDKLPEEDIDWLIAFTTKIKSSTTLMDYLALGGDLTKLNTIIDKVDLRELLTSIIFPNILGRTDGENNYLGV